MRKSSAFRKISSPEFEAGIASCVHCGFCLPTCPTYALWGEEADSPRGRIVLMKDALETGSFAGAAAHFDNCLGCMACVTACPSGVPYDQLIEATRPQVERDHRRPLPERLFRKAILAVLTHPGRVRALLPLGRLLPRTRRLTPKVAWRRRRLEEWTPATAPERTGRAGLLRGCVARVVFPQVNEATVGVLAAAGWDVAAPARPRCCGALALHAGEGDAAKALAKEAITAFAGCDVVVANAAGCGSAMRDYGRLLAGEEAWAQRAAEHSARVRDVTEVLADAPLDRLARHPVELKVAYHDACHLAHAQRVRSQPRAVLAAIPGVEVAEPEGWEVCCGSAGTYNLTQPDAAAELGRRKAAALVATGAEAVAAGNPGCALQIAAYTDLPVHHPVELLWWSFTGRAAQTSVRRTPPRFYRYRGRRRSP